MKRILIIDDHPANLKLARLLLMNAGYDVRTAGDSMEALETTSILLAAADLMISTPRGWTA